MTERPAGAPPAEPRGARARWGAAALVAPAAAAVFTGATGWALSTPAPGTSAAPKPAPTADPALARLRSTVAAEQSRVAALQRQAAALQAKANALTASTRALTAGGGVPAPAAAPQLGSTVPAPAAAPPMAAAPAPAPPAHTTTGASGARP